MTAGLPSSPIQNGLSVLDIVREYFPTANDRVIDHIVWSKTGYPSFWRIGIDGRTPEECFRTQLAREAERVGRGVSGCYFCGSEIPMMIGNRNDTYCPVCHDDPDIAMAILAINEDPRP